MLEGDLGSGKTTLVKKLVRALGSDDSVSSPTFSLVNEYHTTEGKIIYHSDWYRVKDINELYDAGMEEYVYGENLLIIEWPEIGLAFLENENLLRITIKHEKTGRSYYLESTENSQHSSQG